MDAGWYLDHILRTIEWKAGLFHFMHLLCAKIVLAGQLCVWKQHTTQSSTESQHSPSHTTHSLDVEKCWTSWHSWHSWCILHELHQQQAEDFDLTAEGFAFPAQKSLPARQSSRKQHKAKPNTEGSKDPQVVKAVPPRSPPASS